MKLIYEFIAPEEQLALEEFEFVRDFLYMTGRSQIGWHYLTDIIWVYNIVKKWPRNLRILDAGGGTGPLQFFLAELGFDITNVDLSLQAPSEAIRSRYKMRYETFASFEPTEYIDLLNSFSSLTNRGSLLKSFVKGTWLYKFISKVKYNSCHNRWHSYKGNYSPAVGSISWCRGNLCNMPELQDNSFDAVVSLSAWEHIPYDTLPKAIVEINRVLKNDARWAVTTSATEKSSTWWHKPSKSNCFCESSLQELFGAVRGDSSKDSAIVLDEYKNCSYLEENLADFYRKSGNYGMPWGKWDPKYIPVGLTR